MIFNWQSQRRHAQQRRQAVHASRLHLECLEGREVPSTFTVNTTLDDLTPANGKMSLREAISHANTNPGADTIVLSAGLFKITQPGANENGNVGGDCDITGAVTIQGAGVGLTIIDGQKMDRVFDVLGTAPSSIKVVFAGLTIRNGKVSGDGGGIRVSNADLVVRDSVVSGNLASANGTGGGISNATLPGTGNVTITRTTVARNVADSDGGGVAVLGSSTLTMNGSTVRRNVSATSSGGIIAETATVTNSTISGNRAGASSGGGILATTLTLTGSTVSGNSATGNGGGIRVSMLTMSSSTVSGNTASGDGGGINSDTAATLTGSTVSGNNSGGFGGGLFGDTVTLTSSTVSGNVATTGGGGISANTANLTTSTVSGNTARTGSGGGIFTSVGTLTRCTLSGNYTGNEGGGIVATTTTLTNCTVYGNTAKAEGGGILSNTGTLLNCTIVENIAHRGGGLFHAVGGTFNVRNSIVALNVVNSTGTEVDISGAFTSGGHNLIGDGTGGGGITNGTHGDHVGTDLNPIDPKLGPLQNNGGTTKTLALLAGSLAIDAGDNASLPPTDQRGAGFPRVKDGNGDGFAIVDIGAFEK